MTPRWRITKGFRFVEDGAVCAPSAEPAYDELAHLVIEDRSSPPVLFLAAWHYLYGWHRDRLPRLVEEARRG